MYKGYYGTDRVRFTTVDGSKLPSCLDKGPLGWASNPRSRSPTYPMMITDPGEIFVFPYLNRYEIIKALFFIQTAYLSCVVETEIVVDASTTSPRITLGLMSSQEMIPHDPHPGKKEYTPRSCDVLIHSHIIF